ncbi:hypothetical protein ACKUVQ_14445 [Mycobacterium seoulense]|uniref:Uncharacterized protein n=1 Tax=Mycobacterium seoulense TaxID=386911 RepID=A0A7I7P0V1_9MYCO|nr:MULTISPECIES: hypothetical protein [Mycobacterium]MCV7437498.1 hypothetical protein [Mycobacterium seoulense]BBY02496.1 hypothetical protein MSEO_29950 [Mycobacterium seoulense]
MKANLLARIPTKCLSFQSGVWPVWIRGQPQALVGVVDPDAAVAARTRGAKVPTLGQYHLPVTVGLDGHRIGADMEGKRHARPTHLSSRAPVIADSSESTIGIESSVGMETSSL